MPQVLESLVQNSAKLAAHWIPKGTAELEKQARQASKGLQDYRQRWQQVAALKPRKARLVWWLPLPLIPATVIALASGQFTAFVVNAGAYGLFLAGAMLPRHGFQQEVSQQRQRFQTSGQWPFKTLGNLIWELEGLIIRLPRSKTDQDAEGLLRALPFGDAGVCPASAIKAWLEASEVTEGPIFRPVNGWDQMQHKPLNPSAVNERLKKLGTACEFDFVPDLSSHSFRRGLSTSAARERLHLTGAGPQGKHQRHLYLTVDGVPEEVLLQPLNEYEPQSSSSRPVAREPGDISTPMPGNVVEVLVSEGDDVSVGDPLLVIEAMKMETEIKASIAGRVSAVLIKKGDRIIQGETLMKIGV